MALRSVNGAPIVRTIKPPIETQQKKTSINFAKVGILTAKAVEHTIESGASSQAQNKAIEVKQDENLNLYMLDRMIRKTLRDKPDNLELYKGAVRAVMSSYSLLAPYSASEIVGAERRRIRAERDEIDQRKHVISQYVEVAKKFVEIVCKDESNGNGVGDQVCSECEYPLEDRGDVMWCPDCLIIGGAKLETDASTQETNSTRNINDKLNHFRLIPQLFQGTEQYDIRTEDLDIIETHAKRYNISLDNVSKDTLFDILEKTSLYSELSEHINLLHYVITDIKPPDISHIEERIMMRHQELLITYSQVKSSEKKYPLKPWYLFYQYLRMEEYEVNPDDIPLIRIKETIVWHNQMMKKLCTMMKTQGSRFGWNPIEVGY